MGRQLIDSRYTHTHSTKILKHHTYQLNTDTHTAPKPSTLRQQRHTYYNTRGHNLPFLSLPASHTPSLACCLSVQGPAGVWRLVGRRGCVGNVTAVQQKWQFPVLSDISMVGTCVCVCVCVCVCLSVCVTLPLPYHYSKKIILILCNYMCLYSQMIGNLISTSLRNLYWK